MTTHQTTKKMGPTIFKDPYYGPLLEIYVNRIINSRMLLDEDLEVLISVYEFSPSNEFESSSFPYSLAAALTSLIGSSLLIRTLKTSPMYLIPPCLVTVTLALREASYRMKKQKHYKLMDELLSNLNDLLKLLNRIFRYFQSRCKVKDRYSNEFFNAHSKFVTNFMNSFVNSQLEINKFYFNNMMEIAHYCSMLVEDCENYIIPTSSDFLEDLDIEKCFSTVENFEKLQILINSKLLGYLGVIFCDKYSTIGKEDLTLLLDVRVPNIVRNTRHHCDHVKGLFVKFKKSVTQLSQQKMQSVILNKTFLSKKLNVALENTLHNLGFISEKTQNILAAIEKQKNDDYAGIEKISKGLIDLRKHTYSTFESLDLLCNMYGILVIRETDAEKNITKSVTESDRHLAPNKEIDTINYDDEQKTSDEYYELYLEQQFEDFEHESYYEEKSGTDLTLLLQELKQALNTHEKFLEAKKKREHLEIDKIPVPVPRRSRINMPDEEKLKTMDVTAQGSSKVEIPCPPVLPSFAQTQTEHPTVSNHADLLNSIKLLASQLDYKEETFGSDGSTSDED